MPLIHARVVTTQHVEAIARTQVQYLIQSQRRVYLSVVADNLEKGRLQRSLYHSPDIPRVSVRAGAARVLQSGQAGQIGNAAAGEKATSVGHFQHTQGFVDLLFLDLQYLFRLRTQFEHADPAGQASQAYTQK